ncbi:MAG: hypothetical protein IJ168_08650 [Eubacterium sp.]|nr:hypothetical protein [Eubacterium sp.]
MQQKHSIFLNLQHVYVLIVCNTFLARTTMKFAIYVILNTGSKDPLTCEQFEQIVNDFGYETLDTFDEYTNLGETLTGSRKIVSDDFRFEFFEWTSSSSAREIYGSMYNKIIGKRSQHDAEYSAYYNNYRQYGLRSNGKFYLIIYVENTNVYAECSEEYMNDIFNILDAMNYDQKNEKE